MSHVAILRPHFLVFFERWYGSSIVPWRFVAPGLGAGLPDEPIKRIQKSVSPFNPVIPVISLSCGLGRWRSALMNHGAMSAAALGAMPKSARACPTHVSKPASCAHARADLGMAPGTALSNSSRYSVVKQHSRASIRPARDARKKTRASIYRAVLTVFGQKKIYAPGHLPAGPGDKILLQSRIYFTSTNFERRRYIFVTVCPPQNNPPQRATEATEIHRGKKM
jgi:hypothetical protein